MATDDSRRAVPAVIRGWALPLILPLILAEAASAYVGPGVGITALGALWAVILAVVFVMGGILAWPFRALLRRLRGSSAKSDPEESGESKTSRDEQC